MTTPTDTTAEFRTHDTPLAAYLCTEGFDLLCIEYLGERAFFIFANDNAKLAEYIKLYWAAKATCNVIVYEQVRRGLLKRIKRGLP